MTAIKPVLTLSSVLLACGAVAQPPAAPVQANDFINLFETLNGQQPGFRKAHARGVCALGQFIPAQSKHFAGAALLNNGERPVTLRFSVGGGNPQADERKPGARGTGMRISLPGNRFHTFTGNNFPVLAGKTPEIFFGFLETLLPDENGVRDPARTRAYVAAHPSVQANAAWQVSAQTTASYANSPYFGLHTFHYQGQSGETTRFRWQLVPDLGEKTLTQEQANELPAGFLAETLAEQVAQNTVSFTLQAVIGQTGDTDTDPSVQWPAERETVTLGKIQMNEVGGEACRAINFDPTVLSAGFSPSEDPFLQMRSTAYAISFGKRMSEQ